MLKEGVVGDGGVRALDVGNWRAAAATAAGRCTGMTGARAGREGWRAECRGWHD